MVQLEDLKRMAKEVELSDNDEDLKEYYKKWVIIKDNLQRLSKGIVDSIARI